MSEWCSLHYRNLISCFTCKHGWLQLITGLFASVCIITASELTAVIWGCRVTSDYNHQRGGIQSKILSSDISGVKVLIVIKWKYSSTVQESQSRYFWVDVLSYTPAVAEFIRAERLVCRRRQSRKLTCRDETFLSRLTWRFLVSDFRPDCSLTAAQSPASLQIVALYVLRFSIYEKEADVWFVHNDTSNIIN